MPLKCTPKQDMWIIAIIQCVILSVAWAFFITVKIKNPLPLSDGTAKWVKENPTETTVVVTVVATIINLVTASCFARAVKHVLRHYLNSRRYISLADLRLGVAVASVSFNFNRKPRYLGTTLGTFVIATTFGLVNSAWTTFLSPIQVTILVPITGEELDLSSQAFDTLLGQDMNNTFGFSNGTLVTPPNSSNSIVSFASAGGLTRATAYASGEPGVIDFNSVTYNTSTGGVLSAVFGYGGTGNINTTSSFGYPASFGGGPVPGNLKASSDLQGISSTYNITQQGLTANVSCFNYTNPADWYPIEIVAVGVNATYEMDGYVAGIVPVVNTTLPRMSCNPNISGEGMIASMAAVNFNNSNYLASVVCPYTWQDSVNADKIVVYHAGVGRYGSLPPTICEIQLLVTRSSVSYVNELVAATLQATTPISHQHNINFWVTLFIELEEWGFQTARVNSLGNMLFSLLNSGSTSFSEAPVHSYQIFLQEYRKGVIEVTGTALRSGYTAYPQNITSDMRITMDGTQNIETMGWSFNRVGIYGILPVTLTAFMTFVAIGYALYHTRQLRETPDDAIQLVDRTVSRDDSEHPVVVPHAAVESFDASDPLHLLVALVVRETQPASSAQSREHVSWDQYEDLVVSFRLEK